VHQTKDGRKLAIETQIELVVDGDRRLVLESTRDVTEQRRWERRRQLLLAELSHRVSNTLAVVQAMARHAMRTTGSTAEFVDLFEGRLSALAHAHKLLVEAEWAGAEIGALARGQLAAYVNEDPPRIRLRGDAVTLPPQIATPFGLVLHELATNAAKYGALSVDSGVVTLRWEMAAEQGKTLLKVLWEEAGGPPVVAPVREGFGGSLIERSLPGARVNRSFLRTGLRCTIEVELP